jgi:hypothetical protein
MIAALPQSPPEQKLEEEEAPDNKHQLPKSNTNVTTEIWLQFSKTRNSLAMEPPTTTLLSSSVSFLSAAVLLFLGIPMNSRWAFLQSLLILDVFSVLASSKISPATTFVLASEPS